MSLDNPPSAPSHRRHKFLCLTRPIGILLELGKPHSLSTRDARCAIFDIERDILAPTPSHVSSVRTVA